MATLPLYSSRPGTPSSQQPALPSFELDELNKRPANARTATGSSALSNASYASNAPLMGNASEMGYSRSSPAASLPPVDPNARPAAPQRTMTGSSNARNFSRGPPRMPSAMGDRGYTQSPVSYSDRSPSAMGNNNSPPDQYGRPFPRQVAELSTGGRSSPAPPRPFNQHVNGSSPAPSDYLPPARPFNQNPNGRFSPAPSDYGRNSPAPMNGGYQSFNPTQRSASAAPYPPNNNQFPPQQRNMTAPVVGPSGDYFSQAPSLPEPQRSASGGMTGRYTPNGRSGSGGSGYSEGPTRLASPAPYVNNANGRGSPAFTPNPGMMSQQGYRR